MLAESSRKRILFITGTDTGAGKTTLAAWLLKSLLAHGVKAAGLKPVCSGGRGDAEKIRAAMDGKLPLEEVNPWHFRAPIAPVLAARQARKRVELAQVAAHVRAVGRKFDVVVVEGAGGLLSPMGEDFNSRDLILALRATPIIAAPNRLGVINHVLLTLEALPKQARGMATVALLSQRKPDNSAKTNARLLREHLASARIITVGWNARLLQLSDFLF